LLTSRVLDNLIGIKIHIFSILTLKWDHKITVIVCKHGGGASVNNRFPGWMVAVLKQAKAKCVLITNLMHNSFIL
jgi:hypothetical protein